MNNPGQTGIWQGVLYEIYLRSFYDRTGDGIGDFGGVADRLDYVARLGVKGLLLNCPFQSVPGNARHPLDDWMRLDPQMGSLSDFLLILEKSHSLGMKVFLSLPVNATSNRHAWFRTSNFPDTRLLRKSYFWREEPPPEPRPERESPELTNWTQDEGSGRYYWFQDHKDEPALNYGDPELLEEIRRVFEHWLTLDVDGFRLAGSGRLHSRKQSSIQPVSNPFRLFRPVLAPLRSAFPDSVFLFEVARPARGRLAHDPRLFHHQTSFFPAVVGAIKNEDKSPIERLIRPADPKYRADREDSIHSTIDLRERSEETFEKYEPEDGDSLPFSPLTGTSPEIPVLSRPARLMENGRRRLQLVMSLFFTFPGIPVLYYGDEIGMGDNPHLPGRNPVRTPMQWSSDRNAGFSKADPEELYNPVIDDPPYSYSMVNVESQERFADSLLWNVRRMIGVRNSQPALWSKGDFSLVDSGHPSMVAHIRRADGEICLAVHNLSRSSVCGTLNLSRFSGMIPTELFGMAEFPRIGKSPYLITMTPYSFIWFRLDPAIPHRARKRKGPPK